MDKVLSLLKANYRRVLTVLFTSAFSLFCLFVLYSFITIPFTGDLQVFMAAANQVKYQDGSGIMAIFEAWELKGIGNRILMWLVYFIADLLAGYENKIAFAYAAKSVYACFAIAAIGATAYLWPTKDLKHKLYAFFAMFLGIFATFTSVQMQAEMSCVILSLFCTALILHGKKWSLITGGIIAATLLFYKSIFILFFLVILLGTLIYDNEAYGKKKNYLLAIGSFIISTTILFASVSLLYPQEFADMQLSADLQQTLFSEDSDVKLPYISDTFVNELTMSSIAIPFLVAGAASAILLLFAFFRRKDYGRIGLLLILWLIPVDLIVVSNMYFQYHYYILMLPGLISIISILKYEDISLISICAAAVLGIAAVYANKILEIVNLSLIMLVLLHVLLLAVAAGFAAKSKLIKNLFCVLTLAVCIFFWFHYSSCLSEKHDNLVEHQIQSVITSNNTFPEDFGDAPVLFLDAGSAPFYADAPSYSRYFFNLPMQRWSEKKDWPIQAAEYEKLLAYDGKYILYDPWFQIEKYPALVEKLNNEYTVLSNSGLYLHSPDWNLLKVFPVPDAERVQAFSSCVIYVRKGAQ